MGVGLAGHVEGLHEAAEVLGHWALSEHLPYGLLLIANHAHPLVVAGFFASLLYLKHLRPQEGNKKKKKIERFENFDLSILRLTKSFRERESVCEKGVPA